MSNVDKYYPVQGTNKFQTVSFPITKAFKIDMSAGATAATHALCDVPKGAIVLGFAARVVESATSDGSATVRLGFTGVAGQLTAATAVASVTAGTVMVASAPVTYTLTANDTFDLTVGTAALTGGVIDVFLTYIPAPANDLSSTDFLTVTPAAS